MISLSHNQIVSISVNLAIFVAIILGSIIFLWKIKLDGNNGYKYLFVFYTVFWIPIMLVRSYRGTMQTAINETEFLWIVLAAYGFVGIFARVFADYFSYLFKHRKAFLYLAIILQIILFIPIMVNINTVTNTLEAIGIGIGASCIGTYELLFKEQYGKKRAFLTVSFMSIPPLLANFLTAPIQSIVRVAARTQSSGSDPHVLIYMWYIAFAVSVLALLMLFFVKEVRKKELINVSKLPKYHFLSNKSGFQNFYFIMIAIIGAIVMFVKFSNSGAIGTLHLEKLGKFMNMNVTSYEGYLSVVFSLFQLVAGILVGTVLIKRMSILNIFILGSVTWITYTLAAMFIENPIAYMTVHSLNGFSYGIIYNLLLAIVLSISYQTKKVTKMGLYQSILAIGITSSGWFTPWIKENLISASNSNFATYMYTNKIVNGTLLIAIAVCLGLLVTTTFILRKYSRPDYQKIVQVHVQ